ncbi:uncharacterized protein EV422DRAFT_420741 [Fimicolochytrium jonesii]|uniref:uncharacterized protein n=1 Tax=Fimicolochytrium jonesii TaxID=1396493 RepID=UPI0022FF1265|nr:uncharacterized protein EV422DRAFT_420741 [Fimicolochytrium jonesii]KAI8822196.1 hypothetical protein EV422DRAFT_420741 [Fimicolochytrium jonesii]
MSWFSSLAPLALAVSAVLASPAPNPYRDQQVLRCTLNDDAQVQHIKSAKLDVWSHHIGLNRPVDIRVNAEQQRALEATGAQCGSFIEDIARLIKTENEPATLDRRQTSDTFFSKYRTYAEINTKIADWAKAYPALFTNLGSIGTTVENRAIPAFKISKGSSSTKKAIWFNGGIHAREWISPATVMYLANVLLTGSDPALAAYLDKVDFYITPVSNPDGYVYTQTDRMWRKNRRKNPGSSCVGTDLNRNFNEHWAVAGTSSDPCDETFPGSGPGSELENKALTSFVTKIPNRLAGIDFHSYGQLILRPWGWTDTAPDNAAKYKALGDGVRDAIRAQSGTRYTSEAGADLYPASGATDDWMNAKAKMVGYTIELRDTGNYGFVLPASQIVPTGNEIVAGVKAFLKYVLANPIPTPSIPPN